MKNHFLVGLIGVSVFGTIHFGYSQGCSDGGVCTAGNLNAISESFLEKKHEIGLSSNFGLGDNQTWVFTQTLHADFQLHKRVSAQIKLPYISTWGELGTTSGLGDPQINLSCAFIQKPKWKANFVLGARIASNNADLSSYGRPLPMVYQTSLGSYDLLAGVSFSYKTWFFALGYQQPFFKNNNQFLYLYWPNDERAALYPESNNLQRSPDITIRAEKQFLLKKFMFKTGFVGIAHIMNDHFKNVSADFPPVKEVRELKGSAGFTLNLFAGFVYKTKSNIYLSLDVAAPVIKRKVRPEGLTRSFVIIPGLSYRF